MVHEFTIGRQRSVGRRIYHRVMGLIIWMIPVVLGLRAIAGIHFNGWWLAGIIAIFAGVGASVVHFTRMEPDVVTITDEGLSTTVRGRTRSNFPFSEISELVWDGSALSLFSPRQSTLILADRDFRPEEWTLIKALLENRIPPKRVTLNRAERRLRTGGER